METTTSELDKPGKDLSANRILNFVLWRLPLLLILAGMLWPPGSSVLWTVAIAWIGAGCTWNALRCNRVHCAIMGPLFLVLAGLSAATVLGWAAMDWNVIGVTALTVVAVAYLPELLGKKYFGKSPAC